MSELSTGQALDLLHRAKAAAEHAYAPYSRFPVGAALLTQSGEIITGANVENVSYGLTVCAERAAVVKAVGEGHRSFQAIAVWATDRPHGAISPCGACRQFLAEFFGPDGWVVTANPQDGSPRLQTLADLLPDAFAAGELLR